MSDRSVLLAAPPKKCNPPNSTKSCLPSTKGDVATAVSESALTDCSHRLLELLAWRSKIVPTVSAASTSALAKPGAGRQRWQSLAHRLACSSYLPSRSGLRRVIITPWFRRWCFGPIVFEQRNNRVQAWVDAPICIYQADSREAIHLACDDAPTAAT